MAPQSSVEETRIRKAIEEARESYIDMSLKARAILDALEMRYNSLKTTASRSNYVAYTQKVAELQRNHDVAQVQVQEALNTIERLKLPPVQQSKV